MASEPRVAQPKPQLTLQAIVDASVRIADHDGLSGVSIRRVAAALAARPMSLYTFIDSKDDLVERMLDAVMADIILDEVPSGWRDALMAIARRTIEIGAKHPWIIAATVQSGTEGPNTRVHTRQTLDALSSVAVDDERARSLASAIDIYTIGFATVSGAGSGASVDDRAFIDGITWLLDGFEHQHIHA